MIRHATTADVACSVANSDANPQLSPEQALQVVDITLRTVIGLNCLNGSALHIDLNNGHVLICEVKRSVGPTDV